MNYWLLKTEPDTFSWDDLEKSGKTLWDGVRNFQARSNLKAMKKGDLAFVYHTGEAKAIVGIARIEHEHQPDPADKGWVVVEITPQKRLKKPVTLSQIKLDKEFFKMVLVKAPRLSVQPVTKREFEHILELSE
jgi:predicted RNA-binding protein with PUA-like domain